RSGPAAPEGGTARCVAGGRLKAAAMRLKASQSLVASQGGGMAWLKAWTKGCMSVEERSYFSYHVAAGSTTSEKRALLVMRKSMVVSRSSLPSGAGSRQTSSRGRTSGGDSVARTAVSRV